MPKGTKSISSFIFQLLEKRGLKDQDEIDAFLNPDYEKHLHDPLLLDDMDVAVDRILNAVKNDEKITVYADFDCDGIPAAVILHDFFNKIRYENFGIYIPHRHNEGYGFHKESIDIIRENGTKLIITVDVGITAADTVLYAKEVGIDVVITDHHELNETLPDAIAVVNPKRGSYPFNDLCGAGVAYKLVQALLEKGKKEKIQSFVDVKEGWEKWLLDMVGLATVADMVPLKGENRILARYGLLVLRKTSRLGVVALCRKLHIDQRDMTEDDIGFLIAPRVNAASRMDESHLALTLLSTEDITEAEEAVRQLEQLNRKRKGAVAALVREARKREREREENVKVYVTGSVDWKPSLLGLVANSLSDSHSGAVCVWGRDGKGLLKGSCRSDGSVNVVQMFSTSEEILEEYGGHMHAGGFSVSHENVHKLSEVFNAGATLDVSETQRENGISQSLLALSLGNVSWDTLQDLQMLAPFGVGNEKPVFEFSDVLFEDVRVFGKDGNHTEIILGDSKVGGVRAFQFFVTPDSFSHTPSPGGKGSVLATIDRDSFNGKRAVALRIIDVCK